MTMNKFIFGAVAAASIGIGSAFAAPPTDITATLTLYQRTNNQLMTVTNAAVERFKQKYPNVTVKMQWLPLGTWGEYISSFLNQVASGDIPDIYEVAIEGFSSVASRGVLVPLDELIAKDETAKKLLDDIEPNMLKGMSYATGGKLYFFPMSWNNIAMFYNKDLFDAAGVPYPKPGWTWDDFRQKAKALTRRDASGKTEQYGYFVPGLNFALTPWLLTNGTDKLKNNWKDSNIKDPRVRETFKFLHDLIHVDKSAPGFETTVGDRQFAAKQVAMFSSGHWSVPVFMESGLKNVGVVMMPAKSESKTVFGVDGFAITKASKNPELAWELVKTLTGVESQQIFADTMRNIPALGSVATSAKYVAYPEGSAMFYESAATAIPIAAPSNFAQVEEIFVRNVGSYLTGNADLDTMIGTLDTELSRSMARASR
jgi:multiple sugar transport system substrate-binding protein